MLLPIQKGGIMVRFLIWWLVLFVGCCFADYNGLQWGASKDSVEKKYSLTKFAGGKGKVESYKSISEKDMGPDERRFYFHEDSLALIEVVYLFPDKDYILVVLKNLVDLYGKDYKQSKETSNVFDGYIVQSFLEWKGKETDVLVTIRDAYNFYDTMIAQTVTVTYMSSRLVKKINKENEQQVQSKVEM
jgi:hypothetical protein